MSAQATSQREVLRRQIAATVIIVVVSVAIGALGSGRELRKVADVATFGAAGSGQDVTRDADAERRGGRLYQRMCAVCHGANGGGYKADQAPAITHAEFLASASDAFLRHAITHGRTGTTMSAWGVEHGSPLTRADVDAIIAYLRGWDRKPHRPLDERPLVGDVSRGTDVYTRDCARCHGARGTGGPYVHVGNTQLLSTATNGFLRRAIRDGRAGTAMASFAAPLGDQAIDDLVALLRSWESSSPQQAAVPSRPPPIPLGPVPLNPKGVEPIGFHAHPGTTPGDVVKAQLDRHAKMAILDARAPSDFAFEHIAGAVSVPFYDVEPYVAGLPRNAWLVCYCACPHAESGQLAAALVAKGFTRVTVIDEGLGVWKSKHYPTQSGTSP